MRLLQQLRQFAAAVGCHQIVETAHMLVVDEDLRHRAAAAAARQHRIALGRIGIDAHFGPLQPLGLEQVLGRHAVRANGGGIDLDLGMTALRT
jgi:hypothetical protein